MLSTVYFFIFLCFSTCYESLRKIGDVFHGPDRQKLIYYNRYKKMNQAHLSIPFLSTLLSTPFTLKDKGDPFFIQLFKPLIIATLSLLRCENLNQELRITVGIEKNQKRFGPEGFWQGEMFTRSVEKLSLRTK